VHISVPNTPLLMKKFVEGTLREKWLMGVAILGMYGGPAMRVPEDINHPPDHHILFDFPLLAAALAEAGFVDVTDQTSVLPDRHTEGWRDVVNSYSLVVTARKEDQPADPGVPPAASA